MLGARYNAVKGSVDCHEAIVEYALRGRKKPMMYPDRYSTVILAASVFKEDTTQ